MYRLTRYQKQVLSAARSAYASGKFDERIFYRALDPHGDEEFLRIVETCRSFSVAEPPLIRSLSVGSTGIVHSMELTYVGLCYKDLRMLDRKERWTERLIGFVGGVLVTVVSAVLIRFLS